jgi:serine/threonine protein kinase HipA of HipAB toxin-antitoxin module
LSAWHDAFVSGVRRNWEATCAALARQRRVPAETQVQAAALLHFGRLIGNTDMHFGNLALWVEHDDIHAGRGRLAPVYDMLPMRWRPDPTSGSLDLSPFTPEDADLKSPARPLAEAFWKTAADDQWFSSPFRALAEQMLRRLRG